MMKWAKRILLVGLLIYTGVCVGLYFFQEKLLFDPYTLPKDYKYTFQGRYKEYNVDIGNGCMVNALQFFADTPAKGVVLYFHGNAEALDYTGTKAAAFTSRGYDVIMMDYPTYGKSTGHLSQDILFNTGSVFYDTIRRHYSSGRIILYGRSLGTGIAAHTARYGEWYKALILEAPYYSITDIARRQYPYLPVKLISRYPISTYQYLKDLHHPIYVVHGTEDEMIPIASPRQFLDLGLDDFHMTEIPGAHHGDLAQYKEYGQLLDKVLKDE